VALYLFQTVSVGLLLLILFFRQGIVARLQIVMWTTLVLAIAIRYGLTGQLEFYSNDQRFHTSIVKSLLGTGFSSDLDWWLSASRWPFTLPAAIMAMLGLSPILSLKVTALLYLLSISQYLESKLASPTKRLALRNAYFTGIGFIGVFFSSLALRETAMMFFVVVAVVSGTPSHRMAALLMLGFLRPHLAAAIILGLVFTEMLRASRLIERWDPLRAGFVAILGSFLGWNLYTLGFQFQTGVSGIRAHTFGIGPVTRIASNFFGLQFLTAFEESREASLTALLLTRFIFSETIVIPAIFVMIALLSRQLSSFGKTMLLTFAIYVGIVTQTEFNSFRQNIPLIPLMGLVIIEHLKTRTSKNLPTAIDSHEM